MIGVTGQACVLKPGPDGPNRSRREKAKVDERCRSLSRDNESYRESSGVNES